MSEAAAEDKIDAVEKLTKKRLKIKDAIDTAIKKFSSSLPKDEDNKQYAKILDELMVAINKDRDVIAKELEKSGKKPTKKSDPVSKQMSIVDVNNFIDSQKDAIFVVTGGSFNPPHNGHIGMFQKAYDALIKENKIKLGDGKKVYGVMVPASEGWLNKKVTDGKLDNSQKIDIKARVDLCTLSCDSYKWTDSTKFNASNMIVVSDGDDDPATSILRTDKGFRDNAYYLCGSDYYAGHGTGTYKFICVLRSGVIHNTGGRANQIHFTKPPIDGSTKAFDVKSDDIIVNGSDIDNDASSTMLRDILTKINSVVVEGDKGELPPVKADELLKLISIPVLRKLLELTYILTNTEKNKKVLRIMGIDLDEEADKAKRAKNMDKVVDTIIELKVDIGSDVRDADNRVTKKFNRIETGGGGDCLFHTLRCLLTSAGKFKPTGDKTADMMTIRNAIVDHVKTLGNRFVHLHVAIGDRLDFTKSNAAPERVALHADPGDETAKQLINVDGGVRTDGNMVLFYDRVVTVKDEPAKLGVGDVMKYVSQDMTRNYFTVMKEQGIYGTEFELGIAAALYDIMLCVISHEGRCQYYIFDKATNEVRGNKPGEYERNKKNIWYIYNYTNTHYQYLECIDAPADCPDPVKL